MLLLYVVWPFLWLMHLLIVSLQETDWFARARRGVAQGLAIVAVSFLVIDAGYLFEGVGIPLGQFEFGSRALTQPAKPGEFRPHRDNPLYAITLRFRQNRFRDTWLARLPCPLPEHYVLGFDEQKIEAEGIPRLFVETRPENVDRVLSQGTPPGETVVGYPVYLDGELRRHGWWYYYACTLFYKIPEGTWLLVVLSIVAAPALVRSRGAVADEIAVWTVPVVVLFSMSFLTDINLGLRYVLPILPYVFIALGKVVPWIARMTVAWRRAAGSIAGCSLAPDDRRHGADPSALPGLFQLGLGRARPRAGAPDRQQPRLGPGPGRPSGMVAGNDSGRADRPGVFRPDQPVDLRDARRAIPLVPAADSPRNVAIDASRVRVLPGRAANRLEPGYYAVSVSVLYGLPWRYYDPVPPGKLPPEAMSHMWNARDDGAFSYFRKLTRPYQIGHSINIYQLSAEDAARLNVLLGIDPRSGS